MDKEKSPILPENPYVSYVHDLLSDPAAAGDGFDAFLGFHQLVTDYRHKRAINDPELPLFVSAIGAVIEKGDEENLGVNADGVHLAHNLNLFEELAPSVAKAEALLSVPDRTNADALQREITNFHAYREMFGGSAQ